MTNTIQEFSMSTDANKKLSEHFSVKEFACKDGSDLVLIDTKLIELLEKIRIHFKLPVKITSGYRTPSYNKKIGGAKYSQHLLGTAADFFIAGIPPSKIYRAIDLGLVFGTHYGGLGKYTRFTHIDTRDYKARWSGH